MGGMATCPPFVIFQVPDNFDSSSDSNTFRAFSKFSSNLATMLAATEISPLSYTYVSKLSSSNSTTAQYQSYNPAMCDANFAVVQFMEEGFQFSALSGTALSSFLVFSPSRRSSFSKSSFI